MVSLYSFVISVKLTENIQLIVNVLSFLNPGCQTETAFLSERGTESSVQQFTEQNKHDYFVLSQAGGGERQVEDEQVWRGREQVGLRQEIQVVSGVTGLKDDLAKTEVTSRAYMLQGLIVK